MMKRCFLVLLLLFIKSVAQDNYLLKSDFCKLKKMTSSLIAFNLPKSSLRMLSDSVVEKSIHQCLLNKYDIKSSDSVKIKVYKVDSIYYYEMELLSRSCAYNVCICGFSINKSLLCSSNFKVKSFEGELRYMISNNRLVVFKNICNVDCEYQNTVSMSYDFSSKKMLIYMDDGLTRW